jgi:hypothetical protein
LAISKAALPPSGRLRAYSGSYSLQVVNDDFEAKAFLIA